MMDILLDGLKLDFINKGNSIDGDIIYNYSDNSKKGFNPHMIKENQFNEMLESGRIKQFALNVKAEVKDGN